jgi:fucose 4-O-acetylase-like acetyltransferase
MEKKEWVDIMKGIGILSVVAGHCYYGATKQIIFLFHMPLFFFLSGYLFNKKTNLVQYFKDKFVHLLIPYLAFLLILYFPFSIPESSSSTEWLNYFIKPFIGGRALSNSVAIFWFVTCLFITQQITNVLIVKLNKKIFHFILLVFLLISYTNSLWFPEIWLPLNFNVVFAAAPIFYIGHIIKAKDFDINFIVILILTIIVVVSSFYINYNTYDMKYTQYGIPFITLLSSITIVIFIKQISIFISKNKNISFPLKEIGKASMIIMYLHIPIKLIGSQYLSENSTFLFISSTTISYLLYVIFSKTKVTRALLLGSKNDFKSLLR